jgi:hypothetical protein
VNGRKPELVKMPHRCRVLSKKLAERNHTKNEKLKVKIKVKENEIHEAKKG